MRPFKRVIGIDLHEGMLKIARENMTRMQKRVQCRDIELLQANAAQFEVPDDVNTVFMFNPFGGEILQAAIAQTNASLIRCPRTITLFFLYPPKTASDPFEKLESWSLLTEIRVDQHLSLRFPVYQTGIGEVERSSICPGGYSNASTPKFPCNVLRRSWERRSDLFDAALAAHKDRASVHADFDRLAH